jgi:tetratricopeptide (TPR) repeat protein
MLKDSSPPDGRAGEQPEYKKYLKEARKLEQEDDYQGALKCYNRAIELAPDSLLVRLSRAGHYMNRLMFREAIVDYNKAIELTPDNSPAYFGRAMAYLGLEDTEKALADFTKSIELDPNKDLLYSGRANLYMEMDRLDDALSDYNKAVKLSPQKSYVYSGRAWVYQALDKFDEALADYNKAIELNTKDYGTYWGRAELYRKMGRLDDALSDYNTVIQSNPKEHIFYLKLAEFFEETNKPDEALLNYDRAIKARPDYFLPYMLRARFYEKIGQTDKVPADYSRAIEVLPDAPGPYLERAEFYKRQGDRLDLALADAQKAIEIKPDLPDGYFIKGSILLEQKSYSEAVKVFESALKCKLYRGQLKPLTEFYYTWAKGLFAYYQEDDSNKALSNFSQAKQFSGELMDWKKDDERFMTVVYLIDAYIELIPKDNRLKGILSEPDKLSQKTVELDGLRESFSGMLKLSAGWLVEIDTLLETKRDICALLLSLDHPQSIKLLDTEKILSEIEGALKFLKYEHTDELMRILKENRQKLEQSKKFTTELSRVGDMADGALTISSSSQLVSTIPVEKRLVEEEIEETIIDQQTGASIKRRRKYQYIPSSPLQGDREFFIDAARHRALTKPKITDVNIFGLIKTLREQAGINAPLTPQEISIHFIDPLYRTVRIETKLDQWVVVGNQMYRIVEDLGFPSIQKGQQVSTAYLVELANRGNIKASNRVGKTERRLEQNRLATAIRRLNLKLKQLFGLETDPIEYSVDGYKPLFELIPYKAPEND